MPASTKTPLGASTLNRKWYLDVNTGTYAAPTWTPVLGLAEFKDGLDPTSQDDADFDSEGYKSSTISALGWSLELKLQRKVQAAVATAYDTGQEKLRTVSGELGVNNRVDVRWYEMEEDGPRVEAYRGYASVSWSPDGGAMDALSTVTVTINGQGKRTAITHPDAASVPKVYSVTPATGAAAGGELVTITGSGFLAATAVEFGADAATDYNIVDDYHIAAIAPAHAAGAVTVTVTNATGDSTDPVSFTYS